MKRHEFLRGMKSKLLSYGQQDVSLHLEDSQQDWEGDIAKRAFDAAATEVEAGLQTHKASTQREISSALRRFEQGTYGRCEDPECGKDISMERLSAIPFTRYCIECALRNEKKNGSSLQHDSWDLISDEPPVDVKALREIPED